MKKNGFTMIELLAVIVLFATISVIGITSFDFTKDIYGNQKNKANDANIKKAITTYYQQLYKNDKLKAYEFQKDNNGKITKEMFFCIEYKNLVENGYLEDDDVPLTSGNTKYNYVKIEAESEYKLKYTNTNNPDECKKEKFNIASSNNIKDETKNVEFTVAVAQSSATSYVVDLIYYIKVLEPEDTYSKIRLEFVPSSDFKYNKDNIDFTDSLFINIDNSKNPANISNIKNLYSGKVRGNIKFNIDLKKQEIGERYLFNRINILKYNDGDDIVDKSITLENNLIPKVLVTKYMETLIN